MSQASQYIFAYRDTSAGYSSKTYLISDVYNWKGWALNSEWRDRLARHSPAFSQRYVEVFQHITSRFTNPRKAVLAGIGDVLSQHHRREGVDLCALGHLWNPISVIENRMIENTVFLPAAGSVMSLHRILPSHETSGCWSSGSADDPLLQHFPARCEGPWHALRAAAAGIKLWSDWQKGLCIESATDLYGRIMSDWAENQIYKGVSVQPDLELDQECPTGWILRRIETG